MSRSHILVQDSRRLCMVECVEVSEADRARQQVSEPVYHFRVPSKQTQLRQSGAETPKWDETGDRAT